MSASPVSSHPSCSDISNNMEIMEVANGVNCVPSLPPSSPPLFEPNIKTETLKDIKNHLKKPETGIFGSCRKSYGSGGYSLRELER